MYPTIIFITGKKSRLSMTKRTWCKFYFCFHLYKPLGPIYCPFAVLPLVNIPTIVLQ